MRNKFIWKDQDGNKIACYEKLKVMEQNLSELGQMLQDTFEDGLLMNIDEVQLRDCLTQLVQNLNNPYKGKHV